MPRTFEDLFRQLGAEPSSRAMEIDRTISELAGHPTTEELLKRLHADVYHVAPAPERATLSTEDLLKRLHGDVSHVAPAQGGPSVDELRERLRRDVQHAAPPQPAPRQPTVDELLEQFKKDTGLKGNFAVRLKR